jgi:uncharacterized membrane protein (DUF4010 family)
MNPVTFPAWLPPEAVKIGLVLFLSFLIGLEREGHKAAGGSYTFGGVRTFPLIGLIGYAVALLSGAQILPVTLGFLAVAGFMMISYWHKLEASHGEAGVTTEVSALTIYLVGALVYDGHFWIATTLSVASVLLLELKQGLEGLTKKVPPEEILTFTKFLMLTAVILPVLPHAEYGPFHISPFKTWLVVVAVSAVSYGSYVLQKLSKGRGGVVLAAVLGGAYSSTVTTIVLSRQAKQQNRPHLFAGGSLVATGISYLRFVVLLGLFNRALMERLLPSFLALAAAAVIAGLIWARWTDGEASALQQEFEVKNPLELSAALLFAALFVTMLVGTGLAVRYLGIAGVFSLAGFMGVTDVAPFILSMTQAAGAITPMGVAAGAIVIAAASNSAIRGIYAFALADRKTGIQTLVLLWSIAAVGLLPLFWVVK